MVEKKPVPEDWPHIVGDYVVGDEESPVAVVTLGSHMEDDRSKDACSSTGLIAACHGLHQRLKPSHPPDGINKLGFGLTAFSLVS